MTIFDDFSFLTMTKASLENAITATHRAKGIWVLELMRCRNNVLHSKTKKEREFWEGRVRRAQEIADYDKRAYDYLVNIKINHYD